MCVIYVYIYIYIYVYVYIRIISFPPLTVVAGWPAGWLAGWLAASLAGGLPGRPGFSRGRWLVARPTANLRTEILDFRGSDSSRVSIFRGGMLMPIGNLPEMSSPCVILLLLLIVIIIHIYIYIYLSLHIYIYIDMYNIYES